MMSGLISAVVTALTAADISARSAFAASPIDRSESGVCVGIGSAEQTEGGLARYLGVRTDAQNGETEVYGLRCTVALGLDVYAPMGAEDAPGACLDLFDAAAEVIADMPGLRVLSLSCGTPAPDERSGMFRLSGAVRCSALLLRTESGAAESTFTDFVLKGELQQ